MKAFNYLEASKRFSDLLIIAQREEIEIYGEDGTIFSLKVKKQKNKTSPFDIPGIKTRATTLDILQAIRDSRMSQPIESTIQNHD